MKKALSFILCFIFLYACMPNSNPRVWSDAYEQNLRHQLDEDMKARLPDDAKRADLVKFMIKRLKAELPDGIESVSMDSLNHLAAKIGIDYGYSLGKAATGTTGLTPTLRPWSKQIENAFREAVLSDTKPEGIKEQTILCDCFIMELKKAYPDSVMLPFPHDTLQKVARVCYDRMKH